MVERFPKQYLEYQEGRLQRRMASIRPVFAEYMQRGLINNTHLAGPILDCFAATGPVTAVIHDLGAKGTTLVELASPYIEIGIILGSIKSSDDIKSGVGKDVNNFLSDRAKLRRDVSMITCFGIAGHYIPDPEKFHSDAVRCIKPGGILIITCIGEEDALNILKSYEKVYGGEMSINSGSMHNWDTCRYFEKVRK